MTMTMYIKLAMMQVAAGKTGMQIPRSKFAKYQVASNIMKYNEKKLLFAFSDTTIYIILLTAGMM